MKPSYIQDFLRAGTLAKETRAFGLSLIKKGASYNHVITQIQHKIRELGAIPAFPPQIALNDVAAHFLPFPGSDIIFSTEVVKLDVGICYNGAIGDCAATVDLSGKHQGLIDAAEAALLNAEKSIKVGMPIREIGAIIEKTIASYGFKPVRNLCGHGLGFYKTHTSPLIPNCDDRSAGVIKPGMTFAIEPFATNGRGLIYESGNATIFSLAQEKQVSSEKARQLLEKIKTFKGLPFAIHDLLTENSSPLSLQQILHEFLHAKIIYGYPPLVEEGHGYVAQAENSILVDPSGKVIVSTR